MNFLERKRLLIEEKLNKNPMKYIKENPLNLEYIENQTEELCLQAVVNNPLALQFVKDQTDKICMEAIMRHGSALQYVKEPKEQIYITALKKSFYNILYLNNNYMAHFIKLFKVQAFEMVGYRELVLIVGKYEDDYYLDYINSSNALSKKVLNEIEIFDKEFNNSEFRKEYKEFFLNKGNSIKIV